MTEVTWPLFGALALTGLAGSLHCVGMCGPILLGLSRRLPEGRSFSSDALAYHLGRLWTYALLGLAAGAFGLRLERAWGGPGKKRNRGHFKSKLRRVRSAKSATTIPSASRAFFVGRLDLRVGSLDGRGREVGDHVGGAREVVGAQRQAVGVQGVGPQAETEAQGADEHDFSDEPDQASGIR